IDAQPHRALLVLGYPSVEAAGHDVPRLRELRPAPVALEGMDDMLIRLMRQTHIHPDAITLMPPGEGWLVAEFGGDTPQEAHDRAEQAKLRLTRERDAATMYVYADDVRQQKI